jgi:hypothetical protein
VGKKTESERTSVTPSKAAPRTKRHLAAAVITLAGLTSCQPTATVSAPSPSPKPTTIVSNPVLVSPIVLVALGPHGVAAMNCGVQDIAWPTDSQPIANNLEPITDSVEIVSQAGGQPTVIARAKHGGNLVSPVPITEPWVVYIEYSSTIRARAPTSGTSKRST